MSCFSDNKRTIEYMPLYLSVDSALPFFLIDFLLIDDIHFLPIDDDDDVDSVHSLCSFAVVVVDDGDDDVDGPSRVCVDNSLDS